MDYEKLRHWLRNFINLDEEVGQYHFNGVLHLMLALLDNLRENANEGDFEEMGDSFTDDQAAFFLKLAEYVSRRQPDSSEP